MSWAFGVIRHGHRKWIQLKLNRRRIAKIAQVEQIACRALPYYIRCEFQLISRVVCALWTLVSAHCSCSTNAQSSSGDGPASTLARGLRPSFRVTQAWGTYNVRIKLLSVSTYVGELRRAITGKLDAINAWLAYGRVQISVSAPIFRLSCAQVRNEPFDRLRQQRCARTSPLRNDFTVIPFFSASRKYSTKAMWSLQYRFKLLVLLLTDFKVLWVGSFPSLSVVFAMSEVVSLSKKQPTCELYIAAKRFR